MKASVFIATSLDGFIARKNGDIDWLGSPNPEDEEDYGYRAFIDAVDVLVMGRNTFEKVLSFGEWPYGEKRVVVLTTRAIEIAAHLSKTVSSSSSAPPELIYACPPSGLRISTLTVELRFSASSPQV